MYKRFILTFSIIVASTPSDHLEHPTQTQLQREFFQYHDLSIFQESWPVIHNENHEIKLSTISAIRMWNQNPISSLSVQAVGKWDELYLFVEPTIASEPYGQDLLGTDYTRSGISGRFNNAFIRYENDLMSLQLGRAPVWWGQSINHSIIQSGFYPAYDHLDMNFKLGPLQLEMLSGQLGSEKINDIRIKRNIAGHRLTWLSKDNKLMAELGELIIYTGQNRGMEWQYMNPAIPFVFSAFENERETASDGDNDNSIIFATMRYVLKPTVSFYSEFIIDDFQVDDNNLQNGLGYKIGIDGSTTIKDYPITYEVEWTRINSWTYIHHGQFTNWQNRGHSLGYPYGPDLNSFRIQADMQIKPSLFFNIESDWLEKGSNTLSTEWGNSDNLDDPFPNPPVTHHTLFSTSLCWYWQYGIIEAGWSNYDFPNKIAFSDPHTKTKGGFFLKAQFFYDFGFKL